MVVAQGLWDQLTPDNVTSGLVRIWNVIEQWVRDMGPGSLLLGAVVLGAVYYFVVRPR